MSETDLQTIQRRLRAVERTLESDGDHRRPTTDEDRQHVDERVATVETQLHELQAAVQAVRGYAGNVRTVNREVEQRAELAIERVDALEARLDALESAAEATGQASSLGERHARRDAAPMADSSSTGTSASGGGHTTTASTADTSAAAGDLDEAVRADAADGLAAVLDDDGSGDESGGTGANEDGSGGSLAARIRNVL